MKIKGLLPISLIDYPGHLAAVIFTQGCNFRCPFCQNPELIPMVTEELTEEFEILEFLHNRIDKLDGISITGGEPLLHPDLPEFIRKIKTLGFKVKIDTNGSNPKFLKDLIDSDLIDYIAMDIKTSRPNYSKAIGVNAPIDKLEESIALIKSVPEYEFRITVVPGLVDKEDVKLIGEWVGPAKTVAVQQFINRITYDQSYQQLEPYPPSYIKDLEPILKPKFEKVIIRGI